MQLPGKIIKNKIFLYILVVHVAILGVVALLALPFGGIGPASCLWDCSAAYTRLVQQGYDRGPTLAPYWLGQANWAFFPAFPLILQATIKLTGLSIQNAGILINAILMPFLVYICYIYQNKKWGPVDFKFYALFFLTFPPTLWFRIQYTECLFGFLLMGMALSILNNRFYTAALCAFLLCLSRPTGIFCVCVFAIFYFFDAWKRSGGKTPRIQIRSLAASATNTCMLVTAGGTGISLFMIYLYHLTGDSLAFSHIQIGWGRKFHFPGYWVIYHLQHKNHINWVISSILDLIVIYKGFQKKMYVEATVLFVTFMVAFSSSLMSIHRIIMANPLFFIIVYECLMDMRPRYRNVFIGLFSIILVGVTVTWFLETKLLY